MTAASSWKLAKAGFVASGLGFPHARMPLVADLDETER